MTEGLFEGRKLSFPSQTVNFLSMSALATQCWDLAISFTDEIQYLWPGRFNKIKALYFIMRYMVLIAQIVNQVFSFYLHSEPPPTKLCPLIFIYRTIIPSTTLTIVKIILLARVYALCNRSFKARYLFYFVFILSTGLEMTALTLEVFSLFNSRDCILPRPNSKSMTLYAAGVGISQSVILSTTVFKYFTRHRAGWTRTPLTSLMFREGVWAFSLVVVLIVGCITYEYLCIRIDDSPDLNEVWTAWNIAFLSIAGSHLILNMRKLYVTHQSQSIYGTDSEECYDSQSSDSICLTTIMD